VHSEQAPPRQFKALEPAEKVSLQVRELSCTFKHHGHEVVALDRIGFSVRAGTILGVAGESGSGKSTLLKCIVGLQSPSAGEILFNGLPLAASLRKRDAWARRLIQLIFQNPDESLNPRHTVKQTIERPVKLFQPALSSSERRHLLDELIDDVRLPPSVLESRPSELSGGQRQRVAIARALAGDPEILLCDEVTSALDVSVQAAIVELLADLCERRSTTLLFVTHDLGLLRSLADSVIILQSGRIREEGATRDIYAHPRDAYTRSLLDAVPDPGARLNHRRADDLAESARVLR
jgi:peptide/nickel transport system ATP-binding protein